MAKITGYKGFDKNFKCRDFQYEVGKTFSVQSAVLCEQGLHFCLNPFDVLDFYHITDSRFAIVSTDAEVFGGDDDSKRVTTKLTIEKELSINDFIKILCSHAATTDYASKIATGGDFAHVATAGNDSKVATAGDCSQIATAGDCSQIATAGDFAQVATSSFRSQVAASGYRSKVATSGYRSKVATAGNYSPVATAGDCSQIATAGDFAQVATSGFRSQVVASGSCSKVATSGDYSKIIIKGKKSVACALGYNSIAKGILGSWLVLPNYYVDDDGHLAINGGKWLKVDGKKIKANTFYKLVDGKPVAVADD